MVEQTPFEPDRVIANGPTSCASAAASAWNQVLKSPGSRARSGRAACAGWAAYHYTLYALNTDERIPSATLWTRMTVLVWVYTSAHHHDRKSRLAQWLQYPSEEKANIKEKYTRYSFNCLTDCFRASKHAIGIVRTSSPRFFATAFNSRSSLSNVSWTNPPAAISFHS